MMADRVFASRYLPEASCGQRLRATRGTMSPIAITAPTIAPRRSDSRLLRSLIVVSAPATWCIYRIDTSLPHIGKKHAGHCDLSTTVVEQ
mgnify:CR=1 FL=1